MNDERACVWFLPCCRGRHIGAQSININPLLLLTGSVTFSKVLDLSVILTFQWLISSAEWGCVTKRFLRTFQTCNFHSPRPRQCLRPLNQGQSSDEHRIRSPLPLSLRGHGWVLFRSNVISAEKDGVCPAATQNIFYLLPSKSKTNPSLSHEYFFPSPQT